MEVIATKAGYYGKLREEGDKFEVADGDKATWFKPTKERKSRGNRDEQPEEVAE